MRFWPVSLCSIALALIGFAAPAAATPPKPHYVRSYHGTLTGYVENSWNGDSTDKSTLREDWTVTGVVFRFAAAGVFEGGWSASYKVTSGKVAFKAVMTGNCSLSATDSFGLVKSLPRPNPSTPFGLDQDPLGRLHMMGLIDPDRTLKATETCQSPDGFPREDAYPIQIPTLFDPCEKNWKPGKRLKATCVRRDPYDKYNQTGPSVTSWSWDLKPR